MISYGTIDKTSSNPAEIQTQKNKSNKTLKILGFVLTITLIGCVAAAIMGSGSGSSSNKINSNRILLAGSETTTTTRTSRRFQSRNTKPPTVTISQGKLKGVILKSRAGRDYFGFYNVPYGKPPIGNLRFMPPEPAENWTGRRDATQKGSKCIQQAIKTNPNITEGSEDCLHVNIYTPKLPNRYTPGSILYYVNLPVIVYFFGGGFMHGTANDFNAEYFMDEEVIIVIVESRVGALGFLNTGDLEVTGNQGLKDQNLALKWVRTNIRTFGGDPKRVVAFGTSSGAMGAHAHLLSPMTKGLVSGVMSFSGVVLNRIHPNPRMLAEKLGENLGCPDLKNSKTLVECLRNATANDIAQNQPEFSPTVEAIPTDGDMSSVFLPDTPINLLKAGNVNKIPWITGVNSAENILMSYSLLLDPNQVSNINNNSDKVIETMLQLPKDDPKTIEISHQLREFYFGNKPISVETRYNLTNLLSDGLVIHPAKTAAALQAQHSSVYTYYLTKEANVSFADDVTKYFDPPYGVSHADEVQYFFLRPGYPYIPLDSEWGNFSKMVVKLWVSFAETGAPVAPGVEWPALEKNWNGLTWFNLDDEPKVIEPFTERMQLWNSFPMDLLYK